MEYETTALAVANYLVQTCPKTTKGDGMGYPIDLLRLNKLVYISYGIVYGYLEERLYEDKIEAWKYGPVVPSVYHAFKHNGHETIKHEVEVPNEVWKLGDDLEEEKKLIDKIMGAYSGASGRDLIERTHVCGTPWWYALQGREGERNVEIRKDYVEVYYSNLNRKTQENS